MANELKRQLGLLEVICVSAGVMISSGLFVLPALAYAMAGPGMILSYLIASLMIIPTVLAKSELVTAMPVTGGIYIFSDRSMGPLMGTIGGLTAWISLAFKSAFSLLAMGIFVILLKPDVSELQIKTISVIWCIIFTLINIRGVKMSGHFQTVTVLLLILFLLVYIVVGAFYIQPERYTPLIPKGYDSIFYTAGLIFIAFSGTTKVTAIAGEVKRPGRNLPIGIFYSWGLVSLLYIIVVFVTVGILEPEVLSTTFTPISIGGGQIMGPIGIIMMTSAAVLAFISTGNAGLLAASRNPLAMGKDELLPSFFNSLNSKGAPAKAILFTSGIMISVILFLDLETFVKTASALKLILFIMANLSLIFMREANIHHYRPKYIAPFYPWAQIIGIASYLFLLAEMGTTPILIVVAFIACGIGWYYLFAHGKIKREYAILHLIERVTGIQHTDRILEEELREILIERDNISADWFRQLIVQNKMMQLTQKHSLEETAQKASKRLAESINTNQMKLYAQIVERFSNKDIIVAEGTACLAIKVPRRSKFDLLIVKSTPGISMAESSSIHALFIIVYSNDEWNAHVQALSRLIQAISARNFIAKWIQAGSLQSTQQLLLNQLKENGKNSKG